MGELEKLTGDEPESKFPRTDQLDGEDMGAMSDLDFHLHKEKVYRALRADSAEQQYERQKEKYEADQAARERRRQQKDD